ncbi:hypothetical protein ACROYT_G034299 [Oculina patagonica]
MLLVRLLSARKHECFRSKKYEDVRNGFTLTGYVISSTQVPDLFDCSFACLQESRCQSYNFLEVPGPLHLCELSSETMVTKPENYQAQADMTYYDAGKSQKGPGCSSSPCQNGGKCINTCDRFPFSFHCECDEIYVGDVCQQWAGDFDFTFQTKSVSNYVNSAILNQKLTALTFCIWFQTTQSGTFGLVAGDIDLTCEYNGQCIFFIKDAKRIFYSAPLNDGAWHSVCITWQKSTSTCTAYVDGKTNDRRSFDGCYGNNDVEFNGEPLVLGQSMSSDDVFLESDSFTGNLTRVNMWDYAMTHEQVYSVATNCPQNSGNVLSWPTFRNFRNELQQGNVVRTERSHCIGADFSSNVSVKFAAISTADRITYSGTLPSLQSFTLCYWIRITDMVSYATTFSYANSQTNNALMIMLIKTKTARIHLNDATLECQLAPFMDKHWHHFCITWENNGGEVKFYVDGSLKRVKTAFKSGAVIKGGGVLIIGQDQDTVGGGFEIQQSLAGLVSHMNMWDFVLRTFALVDMATGFGTEAGNTVAWRDIVRSPAHGQVTVVPIEDDPPKRPMADFKFVFPTQSAENFVQLHSATSDLAEMVKFTVCLWVKISVEVTMSFFCYRTPEHRNSIAIRPDSSKFNVIINSNFLGIDYTNFFGKSGWQHVCYTWENSAGNWKLYMNGEMVKSGTSFRVGKVIKGGGKVIVGQRYSQGDVDQFKPDQHFTGEISHLNIWNMTLGSNVISAMSRGCDFIGGNWFDWSAIFNGEVAGSVTMETPADCMLPDEIGVYKRNQVCEVETKDGCVSPVYALFDGKSGSRSMKWRCYFEDALTEDVYGLLEYDKDKLSSCYKTKMGLIDIK